jgi:hypothetical protein
MESSPIHQEASTKKRQEQMKEAQGSALIWLGVAPLGGSHPRQRGTPNVENFNIACNFTPVANVSDLVLRSLKI